MADKPVMREEKYLAYLTGDYTGELPKPITRKEKYLYELCLKGIGGEISPEEIKNAVNEYLEKNPVKPGATTEQAQQIEQNRTDVASLKKKTGSLKEDLDNLSSSKISKFYATNNGENHLADSDNGKIADMMVYGKSEQKKYGGYQLIPLGLKNANGTILSLPYTQDGITINITDDGKGFSVKGTNTTSDYVDFYITKANEISLGAGTYTRSGKGFTKDIQMVSGGGVGAGGCLQYRQDSADFSTTETVEAGLSGNHILRISANTTVNTTVYYQLEKGSKAHDYEPYTGGVPSPSPDYPQEIKSVVNPTVKVYGKNLLDFSDFQTKTIDGITFSSNGHAIHAKGTAIKETTDDEIWIRYAMFNAPKGSKVASCQNAKLYMDKFEYVNPSTSSLKTGDAFKCVIYLIIKNGETIDLDIELQMEFGSVATPYEPYREQTAALPYTLNAIPVSSGGNVTIDGQQYIADYVDVERGKVVRNVENVTFNGAENENWELWNADKEKIWSFIFVNSLKTFTNESVSKCNRFEFNTDESIDKTFWLCSPSGMPSLQIKNRIIGKDITAFKSWLSNNPINVIYPLRIPIEEELTAEHAQALKELATYYPVTNISIGSEQLDGYTVFNYPISIANGWNYVKKQLNDNRDYIYDMDIQSAEAYVNSEYAVALTELEV